MPWHAEWPWKTQEPLTPCIYGHLCSPNDKDERKRWAEISKAPYISPHKVASRPLHIGEMTPTLILLQWVLQTALQATWAKILVETASSFHGLDSPSKAALSNNWGKVYFYCRVSQSHGTLVWSNFSSCPWSMIEINFMYRLAIRVQSSVPQHKK
jgi:hypothetical protein